MCFVSRVPSLVLIQGTGKDGLLLKGHLSHTSHTILTLHNVSSVHCVSRTDLKALLGQTGSQTAGGERGQVSGFDIYVVSWNNKYRGQPSESASVSTGPLESIPTLAGSTFPMLCGEKWSCTSSCPFMYQSPMGNTTTCTNPMHQPPVFQHPVPPPPPQENIHEKLTASILPLFAFLAKGTPSCIEPCFSCVSPHSESRGASTGSLCDVPLGKST